MAAFTGAAVDVLLRAAMTRRRRPSPPLLPSATPLPMSLTESNDDEYSYSNVESDSTDDGDELVKIVDPDELEECVLAKSVCSERRVAKWSCAEAG